MRVIIGLAILVGFAAVFLNRIEIKLPQAPPPSPPPLRDTLVGWQDVVNEAYDYKVKMPHDWNQLRMDGEPAYPRRVKLVNIKPEEQIKPHVGIIITVTVFDQELMIFPEIIALIEDGREPRELKMAGETALFFDKLGESGEEYSVFIGHKNKVYRFDWTGTHPDVRNQYKNTGLKILASLQFL